MTTMEFTDVFVSVKCLSETDFRFLAFWLTYVDFTFDFVFGSFS